ncbi:hypothetical protein BMF94_0833 [Rhodotorula taiwanensis]|uniref:Uncharacterized protein n=1 Tax=Rhodotorula taiwanensis TaxID=741276 RepID=A0A2S5BH63_9BASI|nr:hypothetical protein BMF94_0833 [Rhodotorula taiwanensis]
MSLPSSPVTPGAAAPSPVQTAGSGRPPPPPPPPAPLGLAAPAMQARKSLPGMNGLPAKSPARPSPLPPLSSPAHPVPQYSHAQKSPRPPIPQPSAAAASASPINVDALNSDRPESDSENSDDEAPPTASAPIPQKMPRQGIPTAMEMRRSMTGGSAAAQKVPRKAMGPTPRKSVAKAMADMGSSEEDASGVSDSE